MTSAQIRAGRALVNWTVRKLAEQAGIHRNTVTNIETERSLGDDATLDAIRRALEKAGVEFTNGKRPGVRLKSKC